MLYLQYTMLYLQCTMLYLQYTMLYLQYTMLYLWTVYYALPPVYYALPPELYNRGLIYLDIPIANSDYIVVPPLQGFVMNRVQGDYFETLLYKIFVSIDEHTNMLDLATVLQVDLCQVKVGGANGRKGVSNMRTSIF